MAVTVSIVSGPVRSGKSSALIARISKSHTGVVGTYQCTNNGSRCAVDITSGQTVSLEWSDGDGEQDKQLVSSCYTFSKKSLQLVNDWIDAAVEQLYADERVHELAIDEIGKLEMNGHGIDPAFRRALDRLRTCKVQRDVQLTVVVRETLLAKFQTAYNIRHGAQL